MYQNHTLLCAAQYYFLLPSLVPIHCAWSWKAMWGSRLTPKSKCQPKTLVTKDILCSSPDLLGHWNMGRILGKKYGKNLDISEFTSIRRQCESYFNEGCMRVSGPSANECSNHLVHKLIKLSKHFLQAVCQGTEKENIKPVWKGS